MEQHILEDVMKYLVPHFRFISFLIAGHEFTELDLIKKRIMDGKKKGMITFYPEDKSLNIDIEKLKKEKGKEWAVVLEKQFDVICETIEKFVKR